MYDCKRNKLIYGVFETKRREVASITKMMNFYTTLILISEFRLDFNKATAVVSQTASDVIGTTANLIAGDTLTLKQLFYGMMLPSGNDAAYTLAEFFGQMILDKRRTQYTKAANEERVKWERLHHHSPFYGSLPVRTFLREMNKHAVQLGMYDTFYDSPHGLSNERNFSTAYDVCRLTAECMKIPIFRTVVNTKVYETKALVINENSGFGKAATRYKWESTNKLLGNFDGLIGSKTGITASAGPCFSGYFEKDELKLALVLARSRTMEVRWIEI